MTATLPAVRGKLTAHAPLAPLVWFKSGGPADWLFEPKDADDLADFLRDLDPAIPVMALGLGSNLIVRDGGFPGVVVRLGKALAVTVGPVWGAITRLPTGVSEGSVVADASALKDLPTRTGRGWFVGFSYTFLQARQAVEKPFAPPAK